MHTHSIADFTHEHAFLGSGHERNERRTWMVVALTAAMMVAEILGGMWFGSLALLADGWHMSTHAAALAISGFAYLYARRHVHDRRFTFGTGKVGELSAFTSAVILAMIAVYIAFESVVRLAHPVTIHYAQAIPIAVVGLIVNLFSALVLREDHSHDPSGLHGHDGDDHDHHHHSDHNLRAAYVHVLADAATSILAIVGLFLAASFGWNWIDPVIGLIGAGVIASWTLRLMKQSGAVLLDVASDGDSEAEIRRLLEANGDRISDLHLWQLGPGHKAAVISLVSDRPQAPSVYKSALAGLGDLSHVTVEVHECPHEA